MIKSIKKYLTCLSLLSVAVLVGFGDDDAYKKFENESPKIIGYNADKQCVGLGIFRITRKNKLVGYDYFSDKSDSHWNFSYDRMGRIVRADTYNNQMELQAYYLYFYSIKNLIKRERIFVDPSLSRLKDWYEIYKYNKEGQLIEREQRILKTNKYKGRETFEYDGNKNLTKIIEYDLKDNVQEIVDFEYDQDNNLIRYNWPRKTSGVYSGVPKYLAIFYWTHIIKL
ncbi:hypothetical protein ACFLUV_02555 [Elusimicrobiota bacterium]